MIDPGFTFDNVFKVLIKIFRTCLLKSVLPQLIDFQQDSKNTSRGREVISSTVWGS